MEMNLINEKWRQKTMDINQFSMMKYLEAIRKAVALKKKKSSDYNSGGVSKFDYNLHGSQTCLDDIWKKVLRLRSLIDSGKPPENESIEDTLIDLINYSADFYSYLQYQKIKENDFFAYMKMKRDLPDGPRKHKRVKT